MTRQSFDEIDNEDISDEALEKFLLHAFYRENCPDTMALEDYALGLLPKSDYLKIQAHLDQAHCPHCQVELADIQEFLKTELEVKKTPVAWRWNDLGILILELAEDFWSKVVPHNLKPNLELAGQLRSHVTPESSLFSLELPERGDNLIIKLQAEETTPNHCRLIVEVDIPTRGGWPNLAGSQVTLKPIQTQPMSQLTDAHGRVIFEALEVAWLPELTVEISSH